MPQYSQASRPIAVATPLGADVLLLQQVSGTEALSRLFRFQLEMLAESSTEIAFDQLLGQSVTVTLAMPDGSKRYINGIVSNDPPGPAGSLAAWATTFFTSYQAEVVPQFWLLTRNAQSRIFQQMTVPDILKQVLTGLDVDYQLQGTYKPRDYCVQYRETDFDFASRLMEEEGIFYFFTHADGSHKMVVADTPMSHPDVPGPDHGALRGRSTGGLRNEDRYPRLGEEPGDPLRASTRSGTTASSCPGRTWRPSSPRSDSVQAGTVNHKLKVARQRQAGALRLTPAATPSGSTASTPAAATGPATSRTSSRTTPGPRASGCSRRHRLAISISGREHLPAVRRRAASSRSTGISTPTAPTS